MKTGRLNNETAPLRSYRTNILRLRILFLKLCFHFLILMLISVLCLLQMIHGLYHFRKILYFVRTGTTELNLLSFANRCRQYI